MEFRVLGPLQVIDTDVEIEIPAGRHRAALAALLFRPNRIVPTDELVTCIWDDPPRDARSTAQTYIRRLRGELGSGAISTRPGGYLISVATDQLDLVRFNDLLGRARRAEHPGQEAALLAEALGLWRGPAIANVPSDALHREHVPALVERRLRALERWLDLGLAAGEYADLIAELQALVAAYPLRERFWAQLMTAMAGCGRKGEALQAYGELRSRLAHELGTDPSPQVQELHKSILRGERHVVDPANGSTNGTAGRLRPAQLPPDVAAFVGRDAALQRIASLASVIGDDGSPTVTICVIDGMAGVGKTALAVRAAHQIRDRFPDGHLFLDLHGYTQGLAPVPPGDALDRILRALGVPGQQIPADVDERAALYRTRVADQRMLMVLDNAATENQVAPLLPDAPSCLVLVTSRRRLAGLDYTHTLSLETLPVRDAITLFARTAGDDRLSSQPPELLAELVDLCGRLPLAIWIAAARLRSRPTWTLSHLVERLRDRQHRLTELTAGQRRVTGALDLSYQDLDPDLRRTYRLLGLHPGPDIDAYAAAAILGSTPQHAIWMLDQLLEAHLLLEPTLGRYRFHDLIRAHAADMATGDQAEPAGGAALDRLLDYYRYTALLATNAAYPCEQERRPPVPPACTPSPELVDPTAALGWLEAELPNLLATASHATQLHRPEYVLHLSTILRRHLHTRGHYQTAEALHGQALAAARAIGDQTGEVDVLTGLGNVHRRQGRYEQAADEFGQSLQLARATGDRAGELLALAGLGHTHLLGGRQKRASRHYRQALQAAREIGNHGGQLDALIGLGHVHRRQGRYEQAADEFGQSLQLARATGDRAGELLALIGLGETHMLRCRHQLASDTFQQLLRLAQAYGDRNSELEARVGLGRLYHVTGHPDTAVTHLGHALTLARELDQPTDQARAHNRLAHAHHARNHHAQAHRHWQQALNTLISLGVNHTDDEETSIATIRAHLTNLAGHHQPPGPGQG